MQRKKRLRPQATILACRSALPILQALDRYLGRRISSARTSRVQLMHVDATGARAGKVGLHRMSDLQVQYITITCACPSCAAEQQTSGYTGTTWDHTCTQCGAENEITQPRISKAQMEQVRRGEVSWAKA